LYLHLIDEITVYTLNYQHDCIWILYVCVAIYIYCLDIKINPIYIRNHHRVWFSSSWTYRPAIWRSQITL